jgi:hypothetical protein
MREKILTYASFAYQAGHPSTNAEAHIFQSKKERYESLCRPKERYRIEDRHR